MITDGYADTRDFNLQSYASILYLRIPPCFRIILRGKDVEHHNIVNDMMMSQEITYRPQIVGDGIPKDSHVRHEIIFCKEFSAYLIWFVTIMCPDGCYSDCWLREGCKTSY